MFYVFFSQSASRASHCVLDIEAKLLKKAKATVVGRTLPMSAQPFTGTFSLINEPRRVISNNVAF